MHLLDPEPVLFLFDFYHGKNARVRDCQIPSGEKLALYCLLIVIRNTRRLKKRLLPCPILEYVHILLENLYGSKILLVKLFGEVASLQRKDVTSNECVVHIKEASHLSCKIENCVLVQTE